MCGRYETCWSFKAGAGSVQIGFVTLLLLGGVKGLRRLTSKTVYTRPEALKFHLRIIFSPHQSAYNFAQLKYIENDEP